MSRRPRGPVKTGVLRGTCSAAGPMWLVAPTRRSRTCKGPRAPEVGRGERVLFRYGTIFSSLFGELVPGLVTLPVVEPLIRAVATWAGVAEVWFAR